MKKIAAALMAMSLIAATHAQADTYVVDKAHAEILFKIKHMVSNVTGSFDEFDATLEVTPGDASTLKAKATIQTDSINTRNEKRDKHLRAPDFFDAEKYPQITFETTEVEAGKDGAITVTGNLDMHGVSKAITLEGTLSEPIKNPWGKTIVALYLEGEINRKDWKIVFNKKLDNGGLLLGEKVKLEVSMEAIKQ